LKHHAKQEQFSEMMGENLHSGTCLIQIGKDIISFTLDRDVANHLKLAHNENMNWEIAGDQLIISKKNEEEECDN
jgi:hypothetical protein